MTANAIDGFSFDRWFEFFRSVKENPQRFIEAMNSPDLPKRQALDFDLWQHQLDLRKKVARKFVYPDRWIWSREHLQLASDQMTAEMVASHFPANAEIFDVGCGGGSDSIALAHKGSVVALDKNEFACQLTECNRYLQHPEARENLRVRHCAIEDLRFDEGAFLHIDPDRRQDGIRSVQMKWHSPDLETVKQLVRSSAGGSIKLAPACSDDHTCISKEVTRQWISVNHHVVQQRWWWGISAAAKDHVWVSSYNPSKGWINEFIAEKQPHDAKRRIVDTAGEIRPGMFIGDGDPALRAGSCQHHYVSLSNCALIGNQFGFFLSEAPVPLPLIRWHKIAAVLPLDVKRIKKAVRDQGLDGIDLKSRNVRSIPTDLTRMSVAKGSFRAPIFVFSLGRSHVAVVGHRTP